MLRYDGPVQGLSHVTVADVVLSDTKVPAGSRIQLRYGSANRDEREFPDAGTFDVRRVPGRHVAFGHGIHHCLGAALARLEGRIVLEELVARTSDWEVVAPGRALGVRRGAGTRRASSSPSRRLVRRAGVTDWDFRPWPLTAASVSIRCTVAASEREPRWSAQEIELVENESTSTQEVVPVHDADVREARVRAAEAEMVHDVKLGMIVGVVVCVVVWVAIVVIALAGTDWDLLPVIGMAAVVGVLAGLFLGGAIGMTVAAEKLEMRGEPEPRLIAC